MKIAVAFLCYNQSSSKYLPDFLGSLELALSRLGHETLVFAGDNSDDGMFENRDLINRHNLSARFPIQLITFEKNLGFAAGYNRLINMAIEAKCDYFLMLNPDMVMEAEAIALLADACLGDTLSAVCPKIYRWDFEHQVKTDIIDSCGLMMKPGLRFYDLGQGQKDDGRHDSADVFGASGAAALFRLSALQQVAEKGQYLDELFFMYKEDCDLAYRLKKAGFKTKLVPEAVFYHDRSAAVQTGLASTFRDWQRRSRLTRTWSFVNQHLLFIKHLTKEPLYSRILVYFEVLFYFIFSITLAQFLLKSYPFLIRAKRHLD